MKLITLEKIADTLENLDNRIELDEDLRVKANSSLTKMLDLAK